MGATTAVRQDPCSAVVAAVSPARFLRWCETFSPTDAAFGLLADAWGRAYGAGHLDEPAWDRALAEADSWAVAHLLVRSGLAADPLCRLVDAVLAAWCFGEATSALERRQPPGRRTPEVLLDAVTQQPAAARRLLAEWDDDALDLLLGWDADAVGPMLVMAVSGVAADDAETGRLLAKVLRYVWCHRDEAQRAGAQGTRLADWLGAVVGPWQLHLLARSPGWEWPALDPRAVLGWIAERPRSADALAVGWARLTDSTP